MHLFHILLIAFKFFSISYFGQGSIDPINSSVCDLPWYRSAMLLSSIHLSQPASTRLFVAHHKRYAAGCSCFGIGSLSYSHSSALRWLLIISGDVELNPGPVNFDGITDGVLGEILKHLYRNTADFELPKAKADKVRLLERESEENINRLLLQALSMNVPTAAASVSLPPSIQHTPFKTNIKLPSFHPKFAQRWFEQAEQIMIGDNLSDDQCKLSLLSALPTDVLMESGANADDSYDGIKRSILKHYAMSKEQSIKEFLRDKPLLGDQKPSAVLRNMRRLAPGCEDIIRTQFFNMLPSQLCLSLKPLEDQLSLDQIADAADGLMDFVPKQSINATTAFHNPSSNTKSQASDQSAEPVTAQSQINQLTQMVATLTTKVDHLSRGRSPKRFNRRHSKNRRHGSSSRGSQYRNQNNQRSDSNLCYYHNNYGTRARRCQAPCEWNKTQNKPNSGNDNTPMQTRQY